jgi:hypothetical protein
MFNDYKFLLHLGTQQNEMEVIALFMALKWALRSDSVPLRNIRYQNTVVQLLGYQRFEVLA